MICGCYLSASTTASKKTQSSITADGHLGVGILLHHGNVIIEAPSAECIDQDLADRFIQRLRVWSGGT